MPFGSLTLLKACPPCQKFSSLAKDTGDLETGEDLVLEVFRWVSFFRPKIFTIENVPGLRRATVFTQLLRKTRGLGYRCRDFDVDAVNFGVPQRRRRLFLVGVRGDCGTRPTTEITAPIDSRSQSAASVLAALVPDRSDSLCTPRRSSPKVQQRIKAIPQNGNRFDLPKSLQLQCHKRLTNRNATGPYGRISLNGPAPTMTTRCTTPSCGQFVHPTEDRGITLREAAILQSFPLNYRFHGNYGEVERQIGNAVPSRLVSILTRRILASIEAT